MPAADEDNFASFDVQQDSPPSSQPETLPFAIPAKKSKKKSKKNAASRTPKVEDAEDTPDPVSVTPSPPREHDRLTDKATLVTTEDEHPLVEFEAPAHEELDHDWPTLDEPEAVPSHEPSPPTHAPPVKSPRPAPARLASPPTSPPYRPASLHSPAQQILVPGPYTSNGVSSPRTYPRRQSFHKQPSPQQRFVSPPPPHMAQPHFFGLPDLGLSLGSNAEQASHAKGCCSRFDTLASSGDAASARRARDALLVGSHGGLDVYRVLPDKLEVVGRLEGLRGAVIDAKIVPHVRIHDVMQSSRPLIALVVHGPMLDGSPDAHADSATHYQTTVEVYSLQDQQHTATLYSSLPIPTLSPMNGFTPSLPPPVGDLRIAANGKHITVASGKSGEIFVFTSFSTDKEASPHFYCIGKLWTALQTQTEQPASRPSSGSNGSPETDVDRNLQLATPIYSLSDRWLAIVPPYTSASISIQGSVLNSTTHPQPYGMNTHAPPAQPVVTCETVGIDSEGTLSWLSRKAAQGLVKASQKGYEMGMQGWRELTHPSPPSAPPPHGHTGSVEGERFPPTNAPMGDLRHSPSEPALVTLVDLQRLTDDAQETRAKPVYPYVSTFALVDGCNHLSFAPDGLRLLTSSRTGEVSTVWDLSHSLHHQAVSNVNDIGHNQDTGPHVNQVLRIPRSTPSLVNGSVWSRDGDWLALLTNHGTVHLHDMSTSATSRSRQRKSTFAKSPVADKADATVSLSQGVSPPSSNAGFWGSLRSGMQSVGTQVTAMRTQNALPTTFAGFRETAAAARTASGRAVAKGLSQGYSAAKSGASDMWHAEDNKVRHKMLKEGGGAGSLRWMTRQGDNFLLVVCGSAVHLHPVQRVVRRKGDVMIPGLKQDRYGHKTFTLPRASFSRDTNKCAAQGPHGFWSLRAAPDTLHVPSGAGNGRLAHGSSDVETNPPYCPFHVDHRVRIHAYDEDDPIGQEWQSRGQGINSHDQWVFGEPLPHSTKLNDHLGDDVGAYTGNIDDSETDGMVEQIESKLTVHNLGSREQDEEIHLSTRMTRHDAGNGEADAERNEEYYGD